MSSSPNVCIFNEKKTKIFDFERIWHPWEKMLFDTELIKIASVINFTPDYGLNLLDFGF